MSSALPNAAATVYALADSLVHLRFRAEVAWCSEEPNEHLLARVDVCVGRALQSIEDLLASAEGAELRALGERLRDAITAAWGHFKQAWQGSQHQEVLDWWRQTQADYEHWKIPYALENSPLAGPAWQELEQVTGELRTALPGDLRTCFELSSLLAEELYPTQERYRRVGELDVSELRYLTVNLDRQVKQALAALSSSFGGLRDLDPDLSDETEVDAMHKVSRLHEAIPRCLVASRPLDAGRPATEGTTASADANSRASVQEAAPTQPVAVLGVTLPPAGHAAGTENVTTHSDDFRSVVWFGTPYSFTSKQAACVKILWEHWERNVPEVGGAYVLEEAGSAGDRLDHIFRDHPAWGRMIVLGNTKGAYRLNQPTG
jgi:hypothetical protein